MRRHYLSRLFIADHVLSLKEWDSLLYTWSGLERDYASLDPTGRSKAFKVEVSHTDKGRRVCIEQRFTELHEFFITELVGFGSSFHYAIIFDAVLEACKQKNILMALRAVPGGYEAIGRGKRKLPAVKSEHYVPAVAALTFYLDCVEFLIETGGFDE